MNTQWIRRALAPGLAALLATVAIAAQAPASHYRTIGHIAVGGEGGWDCAEFDAASHRVFLTHGTHVVVVDTRTDSIVGDIPDTPGVHGVALAPALGRGWTSNGRDSTVTVFDYATLAVLARVKLPARNPDAIAYDPASGYVFAFNGGSANTTAIDARTDKIVGTVDLGGKPEFPATDGQGTLYVNIEDKSEIVALDTRKLEVIARWPLAPGEEPSGLAIDRGRHLLFAACSNKTLAMVDTRTGKVLATVPIGQGVDGAAFDAGRDLVLTSNGEGTLSVYKVTSPPTLTLVEDATTERGARTLALDPGTGRVYLPTADFGPPPAPTADRPRPRAPILPGTFRVLVMAP